MLLSNVGKRTPSAKLRFLREVNVINWFSFHTSGSPEIMLPATVVRALPNYRLSCSATGTPPIYTALIRKKKNKNKILVNTTNTATIRLTKKGSYICEATNEYGTDERSFTVTLTGASFTTNNSTILLHITPVYNGFYLHAYFIALVRERLRFLTMKSC